ncbi:DedA family protein [Patescibacteria group bacterium]|nr:DedA family protein [Patescibacteria group bacterium]
MDWTSLFQHYGYIILFLALLIEGQSVIILSGFFAYLGYFNFYFVLLINFPSIFLGDVIFHQLAYHWGRKWLTKHGRIFFLTPKRIVKLEKFFRLYGGGVIYFAKLIWGLGRNVLIVAGLSGRPLKKLYKYDLAGCLTSVLLFTSLGYFLGHSYFLLEKIVEGFGLTIIVLVVVIIILEKVGVRKFLNNKLLKKNGEDNSIKSNQK